MSRESINPRPPPPPLRPETGSGAEPAGSGGVLKCTCFHLPSRSKKKKEESAAPPLVTTKLIGGTSRGSAAEAPVASAAAQSPRVTFLASASLSTWWPSSPVSPGPAPAATTTGNVTAQRRASTSSPAAPWNGFPRASSSSFSYWRRSLSSRRVMPHGAAAASARASFSFPTSPASASSSCMSTPKIPQGCQQ